MVYISSLIQPVIEVLAYVRRNMATMASLSFSPFYRVTLLHLVKLSNDRGFILSLCQSTCQPCASLTDSFSRQNTECFLTIIGFLTFDSHIRLTWFRFFVSGFSASTQVVTQ